MTGAEMLTQARTPSSPGCQPIKVDAGRAMLARWFAEWGFTRGAEIGVWEGAYAEVLCQAIPGLHLTCVDPWQAYDAYREKKNDQGRLEAAYAVARQRLTPYGCTLLRMTSLEAAQQIPDVSLDFVYLDANHRESFVRDDLQAWAPKVRVGGVVAGHDYGNKKGWSWIQVAPAVDQFTRTQGIAPWFELAKDKSSSFFWVVR